MSALMEAYEKITLKNNSPKFEELCDALYCYLEQFSDMCDLNYLHIRMIKLTVDNSTVTLYNIKQRTDWNQPYDDDVYEDEEDEEDETVSPISPMLLFGRKEFAPLAENILIADKVTVELSYELEQKNKFYHYSDEDEEEELPGLPTETFVNGQFHLAYSYGGAFWMKQLPKNSNFTQTANYSLLELSSDLPKGMLLYEYNERNQGQPQPTAAENLDASPFWYAERFEMFVSIEQYGAAIMPMDCIQQMKTLFGKLEMDGFEVCMCEDHVDYLEIGVNSDGTVLTKAKILYLIDTCRQILDYIQEKHELVQQSIVCRFNSIIIPENLDSANMVVLSLTEDGLLLTNYYSY